MAFFCAPVLTYFSAPTLSGKPLAGTLKYAPLLCSKNTIFAAPF
jgi:hypothetical protein